MEGPIPSEPLSKRLLAFQEHETLLPYLALHRQVESILASRAITQSGDRAHTQAQNELDEQLCHQRQTIQISLTDLRSLGRIILDDDISDDELRARLFAVVSREELVACMDNIGEWVTGKRSDLFRGSPAPRDAVQVLPDIALRLGVKPRTSRRTERVLHAPQMLKD